MNKIVRFGVALDEEILKHFDRLIHSQKYSNRSEAIRDLMRAEFARSVPKRSSGQVVCVMSFVYDHHQRGLVNKLLNLQHDSTSKVLCAQHVHLDHHRCLEVIVVRGHMADVQNLSNRIKATKGIAFAGFTVVSQATHVRCREK